MSPWDDLRDLSHAKRCLKIVHSDYLKMRTAARWLLGICCFQGAVILWLLLSRPPRTNPARPLTG